MPDQIILCTFAALDTIIGSFICCLKFLDRFYASVRYDVMHMKSCCCFSCVCIMSKRPSIFVSTAPLVCRWLCVSTYAWWIVYRRSTRPHFVSCWLAWMMGLLPLWIPCCFTFFSALASCWIYEERLFFVTCRGHPIQMPVLECLFLPTCFNLCFCLSSRFHSKGLDSSLHWTAH